MGYGDEIMATGLARGMRGRGKLAAFGDGHKIKWGPWCAEMFANNPNIAPPGSENKTKYNLEWIAHYKGSRKYNKLIGGKWQWNYDFKAIPGEFYFNEKEEECRKSSPSGFVVIEPNVPWQKTVATNKDWGEERYDALVEKLRKRGCDIVQLIHKNSRRRLQCIHLEFENFRNAISFMRNAAVYIGPEGGLHHAAAAIGIKAVVIFGGFIPPAVVGYDFHINLTGDSNACGNINACTHCRKAMNNITVEHVEEAALSCL